MGSLIEKHLFELQAMPEDPDKELVQSCMILLDYIERDATMKTTATAEIQKVYSTYP